jgi:hypothetical protein
MENYINGIGLRATFGTIVTNGVNVFYQMPELKPSVTTDFQDSNGVDTDLADKHFTSRTFVLNCTLEADNIADFNLKFWGLFGLLKINGVYSLYNDFYNMTLNVFYQKQISPSGLYQTSSGGIGQQFQLQFTEGDPFLNIPVVELVDDLNRVLVP